MAVEDRSTCAGAGAGSGGTGHGSMALGGGLAQPTRTDKARPGSSLRIGRLDMGPIAAALRVAAIRKM